MEAQIYLVIIKIRLNDILETHAINEVNVEDNVVALDSDRLRENLDNI